MCTQSQAWITCCSSSKITKKKILFQNQGTCFLFHCGPSQNFRCKFTHHANYTSAIFTPEFKQEEQMRSINSYPAQIVPPLSQHEMELSSLRDRPHGYYVHNIQLISISCSLILFRYFHISAMQLQPLFPHWVFVWLIYYRLREVCYNILINK